MNNGKRVIRKRCGAYGGRPHDEKRLRPRVLPVFLHAEPAPRRRAAAALGIANQQSGAAAADVRPRRQQYGHAAPVKAV